MGPSGGFMLSLSVFLFVLLSVGFLGGLITQSSLIGWFDLLHKPIGNPPNWIFAPVWTTLYFMMAVSVWRIWRVRKEKEVRVALGYFAAQFLLNTLWTPAFFGLRNPALGLCTIAMLWVFIGLTIQSFSKIEKPAALLLWPYWVWVTYATYLNTALWWLNR